MEFIALEVLQVIDLGLVEVDRLDLALFDLALERLAVRFFPDEAVFGWDACCTTATLNPRVAATCSTVKFNANNCGTTSNLPSSLPSEWAS
jgi:hypothetical protein